MYEFVVALNSLSIRFPFIPLDFPLWATLCQCGVGVVGALAGNAFQRRRYAKLAMVASQTSGAAPNSMAIRARREKWPLKIALALFMGGGILAGAFWRIDTTLRPKTPAGALRLQFYSGNPDPSRYPTPKILELRELAPQTPAELAGHERRVAFHIELSATEDYVKSRVAYLQTQLKLRQRNPIDKKALRSSLQRVRANAYRIRSVATVKRTPGGWQVKEDSFGWSRLRGWIEDIYHDN